MIFLAFFPVKGRNRDQTKKDGLMKTMTNSNDSRKSDIPFGEDFSIDY